MRALTADRKAATMTKAAVAAEVHQALDVHRGVATKITFYLIIAVDGFADLEHFGVRQLMDALVGRKTDLLHDFLSKLRTNPVNVGQRDNHALRSRDVDASDTCHACSPCIPVAIRQEGFVMPPSVGPLVHIWGSYMSKRPNPDFLGKSAPIASNVASWRGV